MSESSLPTTSTSNPPIPSIPPELSLGSENPSAIECKNNAAGSATSQPPQQQQQAQSRIIQAYISDAQRYLNLAVTDPEIRPALEAHGLDPAERATAERLIGTLRDTFHARAKGMAEKGEASEQLNSLIDKTRQEYRTFREIARACYLTQSDRLALNVSGETPEETARFITVATASYHAAQGEPYAAKLTKRGYSKNRLKSLLLGLEELTAMAADKLGAIGSAMNNTAARDQAYAELRSFMKEWKGIAKAVLRNQPGALKKLGL